MSLFYKLLKNLIYSYFHILLFKVFSLKPRHKHTLYLRARVISISPHLVPLGGLQGNAHLKLWCPTAFSASSQHSLSMLSDCNFVRSPVSV